MNLSLISVNRYFVIAKPLSVFYRKHKIKLLILSELLISITSIATSSPFLVYTAVHPHSTTLCDYPDITQAVAIYEIMFAVIMYIIP
ncbi:hypothetical protein TrispH2_011908, partial [Trichoplax sp. H2]